MKHRDTNVTVSFVLNPNQVKCFEILKKFYAEHGYIRAIIAKSRRVGMSSLLDALGFTHCIARPQAHAMIVAHLKEVADKGLFRVPRDLAVGLNDEFPGACDVRTKSIIFPHHLGASNLDLATAGSVGAGRGLTLTFLHLSECAQYPGQESFVAILPAVSKARDTVIGLESTPQGRTGIGETFYEYWNAAHLTGAKWNGYVPIFLSWLDDPACVRPEHEADDAPATDLERELMKQFKASRAQIAWMRMVLEGECRGSELFFGQEYAWTPEVMFVATGDPAFTTAELRYAQGTKVAPLMRGSFESVDGKNITFIKNPRGKTYLYETVREKCTYYAGVDAARGIEQETGRATGDFASYVILNGTTGDIACRFSDWVNPVEMAADVNRAGRYFNNALMNIELTGNLGLWCQQVLRDQYQYPNWYIWKGKDDKIWGKSKSHAMGFETQARSRDLLLATFRGKLHDGMKNIPGGLALKDEELVRQMDLMTMATGMRWEIEHGHDDVFMACCFAVIACAQYPPTNILSFKGNVLDRDKSGHPALMKLNPQSDLSKALWRDQQMILKPEKKFCRSVLQPL